ncbi:hypothetical protein PsgRace4_15424 [Pseudomonas savastanoi pv. glycinea str. race 4]|nr:hypothetical protein PsgRace4_15424 [Pseudomonas savastanoi pv. glycinea str. race 4]
MTIVPTLRVGMQFVTLRVTSVLPHNIHALRAAAARAVLFNRDGTDDAECDLSDRAKEPDEVGPETGARTLPTLVPQSRAP